MSRIADAEKPPGNAYWTVYDGRGGVFRAQRGAKTRLWEAHQINGDRKGYYCGRTLHELRVKIAARFGESSYSA